MKPHPRIRETILWGGAAWGAVLIFGAVCLCLSASSIGFAGGGGRGEVEDRVGRMFLGGVGAVGIGVIAALAALVAWRFDARSRRWARAERCPKCNYDRTGLAAGAVCPECGAPPGE